ncbi:hypothetical protein DPMN_100078 [Dreissena polymorpha]|uniref:Uncharacterized protein n=1 Tax=Dreissena polymorpha TaxID=45954 RepID=A0A9D4LIH5_DREPO|nr:hypothetical protein DPMN_100078 [Dreissena polymorpha]
MPVSRAPTSCGHVKVHCSKKILSATEKPVNEIESVEHSDHTIDPSRPVKGVTCQPCDAF